MLRTLPVAGLLKRHLNTIIFPAIVLFLLSCKDQKLHIEKIKYSAGACFGTCPVFTIDIDSNRSALLQAYTHNDITGVFKTDIQQNHFNSLMIALKNCHFTSLKNNYSREISDLPRGLLTITYDGGKTKTIDDYGMSGTKELDEVYRILFNLRENQDWEEQGTVKDPDTISCFMLVPVSLGPSTNPMPGEASSFILESVDSLGKTVWTSGKTTEFDLEENGYFVKLDMPVQALKRSQEIKGTVFDAQNHEKKFGGIKPAKRKLILKSTREDADVFIIPIGIWQRDFYLADWIRDKVLDRFRITASRANTYSFIDSRKYIVVFKSGDLFQGPFTIEENTSSKEEKVWAFF